ncbi:hypothetical protein LUTEI9C_40030 [Luteimonas sp. 9C]|nr:hypothetical protein LUTEI9C_40030 [Luteimonas sp. 9C]
MSARDTVATETPAALATSLIVTLKPHSRFRDGPDCKRFHNAV